MPEKTDRAPPTELSVRLSVLDAARPVRAYDFVGCKEGARILYEEKCRDMCKGFERPGFHASVQLHRRPYLCPPEILVPCVNATMHGITSFPPFICLHARVY